MSWKRHTSRYPNSRLSRAIWRFVCDEDLAVGDIENVMKKGGGKLLESVRLFDIYRGAQIGEGEKVCGI